MAQSHGYTSLTERSLILHILELDFEQLARSSKARRSKGAVALRDLLTKLGHPRDLSNDLLKEKQVAHNGAFLQVRAG